MQLVELFLTWQILLKQNSENCMRFLWFCVQISKSEIRTLDSRPYSAWYVFSMHYMNYLTSCLNTGHTAYRILNGYKQSKTEIYFSSFPRTLQHLSWICIPLRWWCTVVQLLKKNKHNRHCQLPTNTNTAICYHVKRFENVAIEKVFKLHLTWESHLRTISYASLKSISVV